MTVSAALVIDVASLLRHPGSQRPLALEATLPGLESTGSRIPPDGTIALDVVLSSMPERIDVAGDLDADWVGTCRRCLREATGHLQLHVREIYERNPTEGETYLLTGTEVDLEPLVRDAVVLDLPLAPLCRDDCAGLCPTCGADRNEGDCGHSMTEPDPRWAALDELRLAGDDNDT